jgi:hypothetical protein
MPVLDFIVALVLPWKQWILTVTISFSVPEELPCHGFWLVWSGNVGLLRLEDLTL